MAITPRVPVEMQTARPLATMLFFYSLAVVYLIDKIRKALFKSVPVLSGYNMFSVT